MQREGAACAPEEVVVRKHDGRWHRVQVLLQPRELCACAHKGRQQSDRHAQRQAHACAHGAAHLFLQSRQVELLQRGGLGAVGREGNRVRQRQPPTQGVPNNRLQHSPPASARADDSQSSGGCCACTRLLVTGHRKGVHHAQKTGNLLHVGWCAALARNASVCSASANHAARAHASNKPRTPALRAATTGQTRSAPHAQKGSCCHAG